MQIRILPCHTTAPGKLAEAELYFTGANEHLQAAYAIAQNTWGDDDHVTRALREAIAQANEFAGLKLVGFAIWERRNGEGRNVTFPARQYSVDGERRSFALLRPTADLTAQDRLRDRILEAYAAYDESAAREAVR
jgi:hypothetical protein